MARGCYSMVATVLLLMNLERTRSVKDSCDKCEAGIFQIKKPCSSTSNAQCECISGYHCLGSECSRCEPDCRPGQGLTKDGCKDCYVGTFNDQKGGICQPWTNCSLNGTTVHMNGTKIKDVVCGSTTKVFLPGMSPATMPAPAPEGPAFITPVQMAQQEDACSCRFPEEEEGGCEL
uniref:Tumor necrosis factor receptor superfamily, member 9 n=1 Tax=Jaculus jaculus TaxID=51337 RepID=A0A8C5KQ45_JACJA